MHTLTELHDHYRKEVSSNNIWQELQELYATCVKDRGQSIADALASGVALESVLSSGTLDNLTPQMEEAFQLAYPNVELDSLVDRSADELAGFINGWKGKLFEVDVRDRLNVGEWVGDLHLDVDHGQVAELAASATQPGWDLAILGADGGAIDHLQLKATDSLSYIKHALEKYPDTHILTTAEIGDGLPDHLDNLISISDISNDHLSDTLADTVSDNVGDTFLDALLPGLPLALIGITEGYGVLTGKRSAERAVERAVSRTGKSIFAGLVGWGLGAMFGDFFGVTGAIAARLLMGGEKDTPRVRVEAKVINYEWMDKRLTNAIEIPQMLLPYYA